MNKLLVICGATATGKTDLAISCAKALQSEIISADSQLIYRGLNIGTAKPTKEEMGGVKHHLIDVVDSKANFSVSDYMSLAEPVINNLLKINKTPIICGGTGYYINSLLYDFSYGNVAGNEEIREKYNKILNENGKEYLFNILRERDIKTSEKLHMNDTKRVIRALEILELSGVKKSELCDGFKKKRDYIAFAVDYPREQLYERINERVDIMFKRGLVEEVKNLIANGVDENCQCMQAIGYKEVIYCLHNGDNESTMRDIIKQNTRRYAKRQITFFKKLPNLVMLKPEEANADKVLELFNKED